MNEHTQDTLMTLSGSALHRAILYSIITSTGKMWGDVTPDEAMMMATYADSLREAFPDKEARLSEVQAIIDEGGLAEALLFGHLDVENNNAEEWGCEDCRADEERAASEKADRWSVTHRS